MFFWLGAIGFGGPVAHVALMEREVVRSRRWLPLDEFLDLLGLTNLIPGPNSTEMAMALGYRRAGWRGLLAGGASFILPAASITAGIAWLYVRYGSLPGIAPWLSGLGPAVVGLMAVAIVRLGRPALRDARLIVIAGAVLALRLWGVNEIVLLLEGGLLALARPTVMTRVASFVVVLSLAVLACAAASVAPAMRRHGRSCRPSACSSHARGRCCTAAAICWWPCSSRWSRADGSRARSCVDARRGRTGDPWSGAHDGDLHRLRAPWAAWRGSRDGGDLPALFRVRRPARAASHRGCAGRRW